VKPLYQLIGGMAGLPRPTTGLHSHNASNTGSRPWCGGAYLAWRPPIC